MFLIWLPTFFFPHQWRRRGGGPNFFLQNASQWAKFINPKGAANPLGSFC